MGSSFGNRDMFGLGTFTADQTNGRNALLNRIVGPGGRRMGISIHGGSGGSTGIINSGNQYALAYYPSNGQTIDDISGLTYTTGSGDVLLNNSSGTNGSSANRMTTTTVGTGDALDQFVLASGVTWSLGADASNSGNLKISSGDTLGTNDVLVIDSSLRVGIGTSSPTSLLDVNSDNFRVRTAKTPASAGATGNVGQFCWDSNYFYVCVATNTWKRSALSTW